VIQKINSPTPLILIRGTKSTENHPEASSGSGMFYDQSKEEQNQSESQDSENKENTRVSEFEKSGMTEVVLDFFEHNPVEKPQPQIGLTTRYQVDATQTKGLLLNKKAE
jgi:hypothetical protein